jgi:ribosome biogenesis GTPase / thiamine phosphate phosphatase
VFSDAFSGYNDRRLKRTAIHEKASTMDKLKKLGFDQRWRRQFEERAAAMAGAGELAPARVSADFGMQLEVISARGRRRAPLAGKFTAGQSERPAVGDWVVVRQHDDGSCQVIDRLERRTELVRQAAGEACARQIIGANLDVVFVVTSLNLEFNLRRIERYLTAIREGGARPVIVLNKVDLVDNPADFLAELDESAPNVEVVITSATDATNIDKLLEHLQPETTAAFVGSSGVGKSTLINTLAGEQLMQTGDIRADDAKGRHTTTHRQLLVLPNGALVIDTPGMREFQLYADDEGLGEVFEDIEDLAAECRFRDCRHDREPGCAVRAALEAGELSRARLAQYHKLQREIAEHRQRTERADWR